MSKLLLQKLVQKCEFKAQENVVILWKVFFPLHEWRELYIQPSFDDDYEGGLLKLLLDG